MKTKIYLISIILIVFIFASCSKKQLLSGSIIGTVKQYDKNGKIELNISDLNVLICYSQIL